MSVIHTGSLVKKETFFYYFFKNFLLPTPEKVPSRGTFFCALVLLLRVEIEERRFRYLTDGHVLCLEYVDLVLWRRLQELVPTDICSRMVDEASGGTAAAGTRNIHTVCVLLDRNKVVTTPAGIFSSLSPIPKATLVRYGAGVYPCSTHHRPIHRGREVGERWEMGGIPPVLGKNTTHILKNKTRLITRTKKIIQKNHNSHFEKQKKNQNRVSISHKENRPEPQKQRVFDPRTDYDMFK